MKIKLNDRELATILAALRHWQEAICPDESDQSAPDVQAYALMPDHFGDEVPLGICQIDELCDKLNGGA